MVVLFSAMLDHVPYQWMLETLGTASRRRQHSASELKVVLAGYTLGYYLRLAPPPISHAALYQRFLRETRRYSQDSNSCKPLGGGFALLLAIRGSPTTSIAYDFNFYGESVSLGPPYSSALVQLCTAITGTTYTIVVPPRTRCANNLEAKVETTEII